MGSASADDVTINSIRPPTSLGHSYWLFDWSGRIDTCPTASSPGCSFRYTYVGALPAAEACPQISSSGEFEVAFPDRLYGYKYPTINGPVSVVKNSMSDLKPPFRLCGYADSSPAGTSAWVSLAVSGVTTYDGPAVAAVGPSLSDQSAGYFRSATIQFTAPWNKAEVSIVNYEYSLDGGTWTALSPAVTDDTQGLEISGLKDSTTYSVRLRAVQSDGPGLPSEAVSVTTIAAPVRGRPSLQRIDYRGGQLNVRLRGSSDNCYQGRLTFRAWGAGVRPVTVRGSSKCASDPAPSWLTGGGSLDGNSNPKGAGLVAEGYEAAFSVAIDGKKLRRTITRRIKWNVKYKGQVIAHGRAKLTRTYRPGKPGRKGKRIYSDTNFDSFYNYCLSDQNSWKTYSSRGRIYCWYPGTSGTHSKWTDSASRW